MNDQVLALAGVFQASTLVHSIATTGVADRDAFEASLASILKVDADSPLDVYGGRLDRVQLGLTTLGREFGGALHSPEVVRYVFTLLHIERRLVNNGEMLAVLREGIHGVSTKVDELGITHEEVIEGFEGLYLNTISTLKPRVMVQGKPLFLQQPRCVAEIRALLLAGVRSAVLWAQLGGRRWRLLFTRRRAAGVARELALQASN